MSAALSRRVAAFGLVLTVGVSAAACSSGGAGPSSAESSSTPVAASAAALTSAAAPSTPAGGSSAASINPCSLLTADAAKSIGLTLGAGRTAGAGDLTECVYDDAGPLIVAVLTGQFTQDSFKSLISSQDTGPYVSTTGKSAPVPGLGDAAYAYSKSGIVEVLEGSTVISITAADLATAEKVAKAVLPSVG